MKALIFSFMILSFSTFSYADMAQEHFETICKTPEMISKTGSKGMCQIVTGRSKSVLKGACKGLLGNKISCTVSFDTSPDENSLRVVCGDKVKPILDHRLEMTSTVYTLTALVKTSHGKLETVKVPGVHGILESPLVSMTVTNHKKYKAKMSFILNQVHNPLTNVVCE